MHNRIITDSILIKGAKENNLKNIDLAIPRNQFVVLTGLSGSGKSSLAYDTLQKECQRQYMESLGMVTDYLSKPKVDSISGLSPSISVDQHLTNRSPRSTVGTVTEVYTYLRILFAKLGQRRCPHCGTLVEPSFTAGETDRGWNDSDFDETEGGVAEPGTASPASPCPGCHSPVPELSMSHFSFNKPEGACPTCTGLGTIYTANLALLLDEEKSIADGAVSGWDIHYITRNTATFAAAGKHYGFTFDVAVPVKALGPIQKDLLFYGVESPQFKRHFPAVQPPATASTGRFEGIITNLLRRYSERADDGQYREKMEKMLIQETCPDCQGTRLREESRKVTIDNRSIVDLAQSSFDELLSWLLRLPAHLGGEEVTVIRPILDDLRERIRRLIDTGVGYLTMERPAVSLSGGEAQRLRLAALLGSGLTGVLYVLDEPTTGLHPRDTEKLIAILKRLRNLGNTVLVIEHDTEVMKAADYLIDIGPGAGKKGGEVVAAGTPEEVAGRGASLTAQYLRESPEEEIPRRKPIGNRYLTVYGAAEHNLKTIDVQIPLGLFVAVTGVSGSGKSTLVFDILDKAGRQRFYGAAHMPGRHTRITGWEEIAKIVTIDQLPIGRISRSNVATYTDLFTPIRAVFAGLAEAREKGLEPKHFSFNLPGGRCERCEGAGILTINMHFLPDVQVRCPVCQGRRFQRHILAVRYRGHTISEILNLTIEEALEVFHDVKEIHKRLSLLAEVGLGYLQLGQPLPTLSGGEAQRIKLAKELSRNAKGHTLYLLDEPTTGLHPHDTRKLIDLLRRFVQSGNTVCVIEHNLDVIRAADWLIDFGPEGGEAGGEIMGQGTPEELASVERSYTGQFLRKLSGN